MSKKLICAEHSKSACNAVAATGGAFHDWVVKMAYDSATSYAQHALFPRVIKHPKTGVTSTYITFESYYNAFLPYIQRDKDEALLQLVNEHLKDISSKFRRLRDLAAYARLYNNKVPERTAELARQILSEIATYCEAPQSPSPVEKVELENKGEIG